MFFVYPRVSRPRWLCECEAGTAEPSAGGGPNTGRGEGRKNTGNSSLLTVNTFQHYKFISNDPLSVKKRQINHSSIQLKKKKVLEITKTCEMLLSLFICTQNTTRATKNTRLTNSRTASNTRWEEKKTLFFRLLLLAVQGVYRVC